MGPRRAAATGRSRPACRTAPARCWSSSARSWRSWPPRSAQPFKTLRRCGCNVSLLAYQVLTLRKLQTRLCCRPVSMHAGLPVWAVVRHAAGACSDLQAAGDHGGAPGRGSGAPAGWCTGGGSVAAQDQQCAGAAALQLRCNMQAAVTWLLHLAQTSVHSYMLFISAWGRKCL